MISIYITYVCKYINYEVENFVKYRVFATGVILGSWFVCDVAKMRVMTMILAVTVVVIGR